MSNRLTTAADRLFARLSGRAGRSVVYRRQLLESGSLTAVVNLQTYEIIDDGGVPQQVVMYDWTLPRQTLVIAGDVLEPRPGDRFEEALSGETIQYEVVPLGKKPCCEWLDTAGVLLLIHTQRVERTST